MFPDCLECATLWHEYGDATAAQINLEGRLLSALSEHDHASISSLKTEVETLWKIRNFLRAAIENHGGAAHEHRKKEVQYSD